MTRPKSTSSSHLGSTCQDVDRTLLIIGLIVGGGWPALAQTTTPTAPPVAADARRGHCAGTGEQPAPCRDRGTRRRRGVRGPAARAGDHAERGAAAGTPGRITWMCSRSLSVAPVGGHLSRYPRQLPHPPGSPVADLHRPAASMRSSAPRRRKRTPSARSSRRARAICASKSRARSGRSSPRAKRKRCSRGRSTPSMAQVRDLRSRFSPGSSPPTTCRRRRRRPRGSSCWRSRRRTRAASQKPISRRLRGSKRRAAGAARKSHAAGSRTARDAWNARVDALIADSLKGRAERRALEDRVASAEDRAQASRASGRPQVALGAGYDYARPNPHIFPRSGDWKTSWDVSSMSPGLCGTAAAEGRSREKRSRTRARSTRGSGTSIARSTFEVRQRTLQLDSSRAAVTATDDEVRAALEAERVVGERYRVGGGDADRRARRAGGAPAGRARSHPGDRERPAGRGAAAAGAGAVNDARRSCKARRSSDAMRRCDPSRMQTS